MLREKTRMQFDVTVERAEEVKSLIKRTGADSNRDLFNNALTLLEWAVDEVSKGNTIASIDDENHRYRELQMPILNNAATNARKKSTEQGVDHLALKPQGV